MSPSSSRAPTNHAGVVCAKGTPQDQLTPPLLLNDPNTAGNFDQGDESDSDSISSEEGDGRWPKLNNVEQLRAGVLKAPEAKNEFTILLFGETGVGKTAFISFLANILSGHTLKHYGCYHRPENEAGGSNKNSQTNLPWLYSFTSRNGVMVRILDTPGLADTRGIAQNELHKRSIAECIQYNITTIDAVLILANGTSPRLTVSTDYALSTLSSIFPRTLAENIGFVFTNTTSRTCCNFGRDSIPLPMQDAPQFFLDNPVSLWVKYGSEKKGMSKQERQQMKDHMELSNRAALGMLPGLFDWLCSLSPRPTKDFIDLYEQTQTIEMHITNALALMRQINERETRLEECMTGLAKSKSAAEVFKNYKTISRAKITKMETTGQYHTLCAAVGCYSNCHIDCTLTYDSRWGHWWCRAIGLFGKCKHCNHRLSDHRHYYALWVQSDEERVIVDKEVKADFDAAKSEEARQKELIITHQATIGGLTDRIKQLTTELCNCAENYAKLSLSGNFAGQLHKAASLVEHHLEAMRSDGVSMEIVKKVEESHGCLQRKLDILAWAQKGKHGQVSQITTNGLGWFGGNFRRR